MIPRAKIRIFDPFFANVYKQDASNETTSIDYSFDPNGCAAATINTNLLWEQVFARGYYQGRNGVEISTADDTLQTASAAGATKLYVTATAPYDATKTLAAAQIDIDDGANPTYRIPVTGVGTDSGGAYITVGAPIAGTGNNTSIPAYGVGATIYRRVYSGRISRKTRVNDRGQKMTYSCVGLAKRLGEVQINATFNTIDIGQAAYAVISNASSRLTDLSLANISSVPTIGTVYSGQVTNTDIFSFITSNLLATVASGDTWVLRVGHDRAPLITRLYTSATNTYAFNVLLPQRAVKFRPFEVETDDEDISNMANSVLVIGDTDPVTKQPIQNTYQDSTSIPIYGQIDGASVSNVGVKDTVTAGNFGRGVLNSRSFPQASSSFKLYVRNDNAALAIPASPTAIADGDVVYGFENVMISGFDGTDVSPNKCPDSGLSLITLTGPSATWLLYNGIVPTLGTINSFSATTASGNSGTNTFASSSQLLVGPGQTYTISGVIDATAVTSAPNGAPGWTVWACNPRTGQFAYQLAAATGTIGAKTTPSATFTIPAGVYTIIVLCENLGAVGTTIFSQPNLNVGSNVLPYVTNNAAPNIFGLASSVENHMDAAGDRTQTISFQPVEPDINASIAERVNAVVAQINAAKGTPMAIDQYCVSVDIQPPSYTYSATSLVVAFPTYLALFAKGTNIITIPAANVTLPASSNAVYVFVTSSGSYVTQANNSAAVAGAILIAYFTTTATGVVGSTFRAAVGVIKIGVGNINVASSLPAPTGSQQTIATLGTSINGVEGDAIVTVYANNVPSAATGMQFYFRVSPSAGGNGNWIPYGTANLVNATGSAYPATSQTVSFEYGGLGKGQTYDFAVAYTSLGGFGPLAVGVSGYVAQVVGIPTTYMLGGVAVTPTQINGAAITTLSANGVNASAFVQWQATNQPTNSSLSRINFWIRPSALGGSNTIGASNFNWSPYGGVPAIGVNSTSPPANAVYSFSPADLMNSTAYDFGFSYEDAQGYESIICVVVSSFTAAVLNLPASANSPIPTAIATSGPNITSALLGTQVNQGTGAVGQPFTFSIGDWTAGNNPGWFAGFRFYWRVHGDTTTAPHSEGQLGVITQVANIPYSIPLAAGGTYDIGIAYEGANSTISTIAWPAALTSVVSAAISPPLTIAGTGNINLVPDGQLAHVISSSNEAYWFEYLIDGLSFGVNQSPDSNTSYTCFFWKSGSNGTTRYANSPTFTLTAGNAYNLSMYADMINATGTMTLKLLLVSGTVTNTNPSSSATATASVSQTAGKSGAVNTSFTPTTTGTYCVQISNAGATIGGSPIYAGAFQVMQGAAYTGFVAATPATQSGTTSHLAASTQVQSTVALAPDANGSYVTPGVVGGAQLKGGTVGDTAVVMNGTTLAQPRHDPAVLLSSTGSQFNLIPDSDIKFGVGGTPTGSYWGPLAAPFSLNVAVNGNSFQYTVPSGGASAINQLLSSAAGAVNVSTTTWVLSAAINTVGLVDGSVSLIVVNASTMAEQGRITQTFGVNANAPGVTRVSGSITIAAGTTSIMLIMQVTCSSANSGFTTSIGRIQFERGLIATAYKSNLTNANSTQFEHGAMSLPTKSTVTSAVGVDGSYLAGGVVYNRHITGATQDGLADGTSYARVATTELSSNRVARVNDGTNIRTATQIGSVVATGADGAGSFLQPLTVAARHLIGGASTDTGAILDNTGVGARVLIGRHNAQVALDATGGQVNLVPDSDVKFGTAYWTFPTNVFISSYFGYNGFYYLVPSGGSSAAGGQISAYPSGYISVNYPNVYTFSATMGPPSGVTVSIIVLNAQTNTEIGRIQVLGTGAAPYRQTVTISPPSGCAQVYFLVQVTASSSFAGTNILVGSQLQFELGSIATGYKENGANHTAGQFEYGAMSTQVKNSLTSAAGGDGSYLTSGIINNRHFNSTGATLTGIQDDSNYRRLSTSSFQSGNTQLTHTAMSPGVQTALTSAGQIQNTQTASTFLNTQGSILNWAGTPAVSYSSTSSAITMTVPASTYTRTNTTTVNVPAYSQPYAGLTANTTYYFDVYYNPGTNVFMTVGPYTSVPSHGQILTDCYADGRVPIYAGYAASTAMSGGSGGGTTGGGGGNPGNQCPAEHQRVLTKERGYIRADEVDVGMHFPSKGGWVRVDEAWRMPTTIWRFTVEGKRGRESFDVNETHAVQKPDGEWLIVTAMFAGDRVRGNHGSELTIVDVHEVGPGYFIGFDVETHEFEMGETCAHNVVTI